MYIAMFLHPDCPPTIAYTHARRTFDRALRTLPPSLHGRIWPNYLRWAESKGGETVVKVYRRYLLVDPSVTERYTSILLSPENPSRRPLEAAKLLLSLSRKAYRGEYTSPEGKSPYQLLCDWMDVVERYAEEVGLDADESDAAAAIRQREAETRDRQEVALKSIAANDEPASSTGKVMRFAGPPTLAEGEMLYDEDVDPKSSRRLDIEHIVRVDGLANYKDQAGRLWSGLATYWTKRAEFDRVSELRLNLVKRPLNSYFP